MNERILITGGAGFIGSNYVEYVLRNTNWDIVVIDRLDYSGNLNRLHHAIKDAKVATKEPWPEHRIRVVYHDLKAPMNPQVAESIGRVDYIVHMAAASHVDRSIADPMSFVMDNVVGTTNILDFARTLPDLKAFLYFSTDEVFGPASSWLAPENGFKENARYNSTNPYAATKAAGEELAVAYRNTYKVPVIITHTMNVFGKRQHPEKFIPSTIAKVLSGKTVTIHADHKLTKAGSRFYIDAMDVAKAVQLLLAKNEETLYNSLNAEMCPKYNIVGEIEIDNLELARALAGMIGMPLIFEMVDFHSSRPGHDLRYALDGYKMKEMGFIPDNTWKGLGATVVWYLQNLEWLR